MSIPTITLCAVAAQEMGASRNTIGSGVMGKVADFLTSGTCAVTEKLLANGELIDVVYMGATVAEGARS